MNVNDKLSKMTNDELKKEYEEYKDIVNMAHSVRDVVWLYAIEDELEKREQSIDEDEVDEERIEGVDEE